MSRYGYAHVSTTDQDLAVRCEVLEQVGCAAIREEKGSGFSRQGRGRLGIAAQVRMSRGTVWRALRAEAAA